MLSLLLSLQVCRKRQGVHVVVHLHILCDSSKDLPPRFQPTPLVDDGKGILVVRVAQPACLTVTVNLMTR